MKMDLGIRACFARFIIQELVGATGWNNCHQTEARETICHRKCSSRTCGKTRTGVFGYTNSQRSSVWSKPIAKLHVKYHEDVWRLDQTRRMSLDLSMRFWGFHLYLTTVGLKWQRGGAGEACRRWPKIIILQDTCLKQRLELEDWKNISRFQNRSVH